MKNIGIIVLDFTLKGGVERFVSNLARILVDQDFLVTIYSMHRTNAKPLYEIPIGTSVVYLTDFKYTPFIYKITSLLACVKLIFRHGSLELNCKYFSTSPILTIYLSLLSKSFAKILIASEHSSYMAHSWLIRKLRAFAYASISSIVTQTIEGVNMFKNDGLTAVCIPNSVTEFKDPWQWTSRKTGIDDEFIVITAARFEPVKQLEHFVEVAYIINNIIPKVIFKIIGSGPGELALKQLISDYGLNGVVEIVPTTPLINDYYASASAYIITSHSEAFPMTMLEALSYGVPVFSYNELVGPVEVIVDGFNGYLCQQNSPRSICDRLMQVMESVNLLDEMRVNSIESARKFSTFEIASQIKKLL